MRVMAGISGLLLIALAAQGQTQGTASWSGTMLDAGCTNRSLDNLRAQPADALPKAREPQKAAEGIRVAPQTVKAERAEATLPRTPDHASRYSNSSCALTADTKAFMLLLSDGTVLDLDEGGNTLAFEAFQATSTGQAILNGKVGGLKPPATVMGIRTGNRVKARSVEIQQPKPAAPVK